MSNETSLTDVEVIDAAAKLPVHVQQFLTISKELEVCMKTKNLVNIEAGKNKMKIFFATCTEAEQADIQHFIQQEAAGMRLVDQRNTVYRSIQRLLGVPGMAMHSLATTVPMLARETVSLTLGTVGAVAEGGIRGVKSIIRGVQRGMAS